MCHHQLMIPSARPAVPPIMVVLFRVILKSGYGWMDGRPVLKQ